MKLATYQYNGMISEWMNDTRKFTMTSTSIHRHVFIQGVVLWGLEYVFYLRKHLLGSECFR